MELRDTINLIEAKSSRKLTQVKLPYSRNQLAPSMSASTIDFHYGTLYKGYVDRFNNDEGDDRFNEAGAFLHELWFTQFKDHASNKRPQGRILEFIENKFDNITDFKKEMREHALKVQGSAWIYLSRSGSIKTIPNHEKRTDIVLLIDMWEHAYQRDYGSNKGKYIDSLWKIMNWEVLSQRL
jgi:Fe-Mn family superoxide dismutase